MKMTLWIMQGKSEDDFHKEQKDSSSVCTEHMGITKNVEESMHQILRAKSNIRCKVTVNAVLLERREINDQQKNEISKR